MIGLAALIWVSVAYPLRPTIAIDPVPGESAIMAGLVFWIGLGLIGSLRVQRLDGHGAMTFHLPFIVAALALGGPAAGAWVAMISTLELRELREVPWYGTLANHTAMSFAAVVSGVAFDVVRDGAMSFAPGAADLIGFVAILLATFVMSRVSAAIAAGTVILRDGFTASEAIGLYHPSYRTTFATEVILAWMLAVSYALIGWWAAVVSAMLVLVIWQVYDERELARHDAMTGLLGRTGFDARLEDTLGRIARGAGRAALLAIDLDGFKRVNDTYGHATGDAVLREVGVRLRDSIRLVDSAVRRGGDEFEVLLVGVSDAVVAERMARRIWAELGKPFETEAGSIVIGASVGVVIVEPGTEVDSLDRLHALADREMYRAKQAGGGVSVLADVPTPPAH